MTKVPEPIILIWALSRTQVIEELEHFPDRGAVVVTGMIAIVSLSLIEAVDLWGEAYSRFAAFQRRASRLFLYPAPAFFGRCRKRHAYAGFAINDNRLVRMGISDLVTHAILLLHSMGGEDEPQALCSSTE